MKKIQILGTGCAKCRKLAEHAETAARELGIEFELEKVTDINEILAFGAMITPGIAVDGTLKAAGRLVTVADIKPWLQ